MVKGTVKSGKGKAKEFLKLPPYKNFIKKKTRIEPFPGTLNLKIDPSERKKLEQGQEKYEMEKVQYRDRELGSITLYSIKVEQKSAYLLEAHRSDHEDEIIEIVAENKLRNELGLNDNDKIEIEPR